MTLDGFLRECGFFDADEVERTRLLAFYKQRAEGITEFTVRDVASWFTGYDLAAPNLSRLHQKLRNSRLFVKGSTNDSFKLAAVEARALRESYPNVGARSEEIALMGYDVLPEPVYTKTRGYIESLARQINKSYTENIFDGCAVLMRRLLEILLILAYRHHNVEAAIQQDSNYVMLERIIDDAKGNPVLKLSRNTRGSLDHFRMLGNFAAHKIEYTTRRGDIDRLQQEYRAAVEELLYKSGIRT